MIYTFYSYKGGVGRSMALANVAQYLYSRGARVVMIDWDLEAPGLENFFFSSDELEDVRSQLGLIDMLEDYKRQFSRAYSVLGKERSAVFEEVKPHLLAIRNLLYPIHAPDASEDRTSAALWLLPAGWRSTKTSKPEAMAGSDVRPRKDDRFSKYAAAVQSFDWNDFYTSFAGDKYFGWFRDQLLPTPASSTITGSPPSARLGVDAVLIDSRTGVTEMGGICTRELADVVVAFCAPNYQNLEGVAKMAASFVHPEVIKDRGRDLEVLVVPARVDEQGATNEESEFRKRFMDRLKAPPTFQRNRLDMYSLLMPYIAKYAYAETLAVGVEESKLEKAYKNLAARLALFSEQDSNLRNQFSVEIQQVTRTTTRRVFVWSTDKDSSDAMAFQTRLLPIDPASLLDEAQFVVVWLSSASLRSDALRKQIRLCRQKGICVYGAHKEPLTPTPLPRYLRKVRLFDVSSSASEVVSELQKPCEAVRVSFVTPPIITNFVDRPDEWKKLCGAFLTPFKDPIPATMVLCGAGGSGKTALAAKFCQDDDVMDAFDDGILWATLGENPDLPGLQRALYSALTGTEPQFGNLQSLLSTQLAGKSCLLVLEDVWKPEHLGAFQSTGARLITTRSASVASDFPTISLDAMTEEQARRVLASGLNVPPGNASLEALARRLGRWPLALSLGRTHLAQAVERGETPDVAAEFLNRTLERKGLDTFGDVAGPLAATLRQALDAAQQQLSVRDRELYTELAIFAPDAEVPLDVVTMFWPHDALDTQELLLRFDTMSLLRVDLQAKTVRLNALFRSFLESRLRNAMALHARLLEAFGDPRHLPSGFAWRWIIYHLVHAGRQQEARALLLDFDWINTKANATDVTCLILDYDLFPDDSALRSIRQALANFPGGDASSALLSEPGKHPEPEAAGLFTRARQWRIVHYVDCFKAHTGCVRAVLTDDNRLISASDDETVKVWDKRTFKLIVELRGHSRPVNAIAFVDTGNKVVSASNDGTLKLWDLNTGGLLRTLTGDSTWALSVASPLPDRVISGSADGVMRDWSISSGLELGRLLGHSSWVTALSGIASENGGGVVSASGDGTLCIWDLTSKTEIATLRGHTQWVTGLAVSPDGHYAVSGSYDKTVRAWQLGRADHLSSILFMGHTAAVNSVAIISDLRRVISVSADQTLRVWDLETAQEMGSIMRDQECMTCAVGSDNRIIVCGDVSGCVYLFRTEG